jgi:membrane protein YdbS with pleckstrin-like domain
MQCPACATAVTVDSIYCPKCGHRLDAAAVPESKTPTEQFKSMKAAARAGNGTDVETLLWSGGFSWKAMLGYWLIAILATIAGIVIGVLGAAIPPVPIAAGVIVLVLWLFVIGYFLYQRISVAYELSNQRLIHHYGILTRVTNRIEVIDIDDIKFTQNILERFLGVGTIQILSTDVSDPKLVIRGIDNVKHVFAVMDDARRDERRKRGMYIETV